MKNLIKLYYVSSPSGKEKKMRKYLKEWLKANVPQATFYADQSGIYVTKGYAETYPCIVAHIDEVHNERNGDYRVVVSGDYIFGYNIASKKQQGIGADDKNGIWIAMQALLKYDAVKVALFVGEEIGCVGSEQANMSFFDNCRFVIQCDRRGSSDFITSAGSQELCDVNFTSLFNMERFGYKEEHGLMTDVMELKRKGLKVSACNLSCGYYNPHTADETTVFSELCNCRDLVFHIIDTVTDVCYHAPKSAYDSFYSRRYYDGIYGDDWYGDYYGHHSGSVTKETFTDDEETSQWNDMQDVMFNEFSLDPQGFDLVSFFDTWKYSYPALTWHDFEDAFAELLYYLEEEDAEDMKEAVVG